MALGVGREVEAKRWLRCLIWQAAGSTAVWILWQTMFSGHSDRYLWFVPSVWSSFWFLVFLASQVLFLLGKVFVTTCQEKEAASALDLVSGVWKLTWNSLVGASWEPEAARYLSSKISTTRDQIIFTFLCAISGFLSLVSLASTQIVPPNILNIGVRGAALGLVYACLHFYQKKQVLSFPIIQRSFGYSLKIGSSRVVVSSVKLAVVVVPVAEIFAGFVSSESKQSVREILADGLSLFIWQQIVFVFGAIFATVCWELCHHFVQVILTRRHVFAPPLGSTLAETQPSEQLLSMLEDVESPSLAQHLAYLDLCIVAESNVDTWRRTAFFEESGETYKRIISACLGPLDNLTLRLVKGLEIFETKSGDFLKQHVQSQGLNKKSESSSIKEIFRDMQLCAWCARTVASLTATSHLEDRYGVAQLSGCNKATLSSLLSCLLVVEVYLGRRSSARGVGFVGPNSIKWTVPSQGPVDVSRRKGSPFGKGSAMHKKAYALADILRTSVYQIIAAFGEEMVVGSGSGKGVAIAERDWLSQTTPLYGTHEMHLQKLGLFLEYRVN